MSEEIAFSYFFFHVFIFWFHDKATNNMSSEPKHMWLIEGFSRNISIKVLLKYLQWLGSKHHYFNSTHCECMETPSLL